MSTANKKNLFDNDGIFASDDVVVLKRIHDEEYDVYEEVCRENALMPKFFEHKSFMNDIWSDLIADEALVLSIYDVASSEYCGYCCIHDVTKEVPEVGIELLENWHRKNIGFRSMRLLVEKFAEMSGKNCFRALIWPSNLASQGMFEKLGWKPYGIKTFILHDLEMLTKYEEAKKDAVTDLHREVAAKFGVEPVKMLTHVLEYRIEK